MIEVLKQALEALERSVATCFDQYAHQQVMSRPDHFINQAITSLRQAIAELESQEPVAWQVHPFDYGIGHEGVYARTDRHEQVEMWKRKGWTVQPLYTTPPQRTWQGLTDEEITALKHNGERYISSQDFARAVEAKLKQKNGFAEEKNT
jgi:hypothetical protein